MGKRLKKATLTLEKRHKPGDQGKKEGCLRKLRGGQLFVHHFKVTGD